MIPRRLPEHLVDNARRLRREATDAEGWLWQMLRNRRLGGFKFRRQVAVPPYILDFYCSQAQVAVELDGGQHAETANAIADDARSAFLAKRGIRVLRFWNDEVLRNPEEVTERLWAALQEG
jgi:very-short-patch-repair endonuclease